VISDIVHQFVPAGSIEEQWDVPELEELLRNEWQLDLAIQEMINESQSINAEEILEAVTGAADEAYEAKVTLVGRESFSAFERSIMLQTLDRAWREHLAALDHLRQGIHLRGYAQKNPKQEYKREAFELFAAMLDAVKLEVTRIVMNVQIQSPEQLEAAAEQMEEQGGHLENVEFRHAEFAEAGAAAPVAAEAATAAMIGDAMSHGRSAAPQAAVHVNTDNVPKVGRNDPCPCGSGKKYKQCHGKIA
jgi:preprotein translocase subunit SecA